MLLQIYVVSVFVLTYDSQNVGRGLEGFILDVSLAVANTGVTNHMTREHKTSSAVPEHVLSIRFYFLHWIFLFKSKYHEIYFVSYVQVMSIDHKLGSVCVQKTNY